MVQFKERSVLRDRSRTRGPAKVDQLKPLANPLSKFPLPRVLLNSQLTREPGRPKQWNPLSSFCLVASPRQPGVEVKAARIVR
ncbi:MAG: hypothetical protein JWN34_3014, partial [Bryobacterales bacterium]|nr:hypothetical protein [Bryobacterales bacterium]